MSPYFGSEPPKRYHHAHQCKRNRYENDDVLGFRLWTRTGTMKDEHDPEDKDEEYKLLGKWCRPTWNWSEADVHFFMLPAFVVMLA